jgi:hypothetical protein
MNDADFRSRLMDEQNQELEGGIRGRPSSAFSVPAFPPIEFSIFPLRRNRFKTTLRAPGPYTTPHKPPPPLHSVHRRRSPNQPTPSQPPGVHRPPTAETLPRIRRRGGSSR